MTTSKKKSNFLNLHHNVINALRISSIIFIGGSLIYAVMIWVTESGLSTVTIYNGKLYYEIIDLSKLLLGFAVLGLGITGWAFLHAVRFIVESLADIRKYLGEINVEKVAPRKDHGADKTKNDTDFAVQAEPAAAVPEVPVCRLCGIPMAEKVSPRGSKYYGCKNYPGCIESYSIYR